MNFTSLPPDPPKGRFETALFGAFVAGAVCASPVFAGDCKDARAVVEAGLCTMESISSLVTDCSLKSVEEVLEAIPQSEKRLYTLMVGSRSLQAATPEYPRVLLGLDELKLIVAFNGKPSLPGYDSLEMMQFEPSRSDFTFKRISFVERKAEISAPNPPLCTGCHGSPAHPIWDHNPFWPESYASTWFYLDNPPSQSDLITQGRFDPRVNPGRYLSLGRPERSISDFNHVLSGKLGKFHNASVGAQIRTDPKLFPYRYALFAAASLGWGWGDAGGLPIESFIPETLRARFPKTLSQITEEYQAGVHQNLLDRVERYRRSTGLEPDLSPGFSTELEDAIADPKGSIYDFRGEAAMRYVLQLTPPPRNGRWISRKESSISACLIRKKARFWPRACLVSRSSKLRRESSNSLPTAIAAGIVASKACAVSASKRSRGCKAPRAPEA